MATTPESVPCQSCSRPFPSALGYPLCALCYRVDQVLAKERAEHLSDLARVSRDAILFRVTDVLRRCGAHDDRLLRQLELRLK